MSKKITLEEAIEKIVRKKLAERFNKKTIKEETDLTMEPDETEPIEEDVMDTKLPGNIQMYMTKVADQLEKRKLNTNQKIAALGQFIDDLKIDKVKLNQFVTRIKSAMPTA